MRLLLFVLLACEGPAGRPPASPATSAPAPPSSTSDGDGDGFTLPEDCDDQRADIHPGAPDEPYDGVDADCAGDAGEFDADGDGQDAQAFGGGDCDDADPNRFFGAARVCGNEVDDDCDMAWDCDLRGNEPIEEHVVGLITGFSGSGAGQGIEVGDWNGDGYSDALLSSGEVEASWILLGPLDQPQTTENAAKELAGGYSAAFGDFDGDGRSDAVTVNYVLGPPTVRVYLAASGDGPGPPDVEWARPVGELGPRFVFGGDVNGDGLDDLIGGSMHLCNSLPPGELDTFCAVVHYAPLSTALVTDDDVDVVVIGFDGGDPGFDVEVSDLTGDGVPDLAVADNDARAVAIVEGPPEAVVYLAEQPAAFQFAGESVGVVECGDLDGDGHRDLLAGSNGLSERGLVFAGPHLGPLLEANAITILDDQPVSDAVLPGDLDGDGMDDLVTRASGDRDAISKNKGGDNTGRIFYAPRGSVIPDAILDPLDASFGPSDVAGPGDVDRDGLDDILFSGAGVPVEGVSFGGAYLILGQPQGF